MIALQRRRAALTKILEELRRDLEAQGELVGAADTTTELREHVLATAEIGRAILSHEMALAEIDFALQEVRKVQEAEDEVRSEAHRLLDEAGIRGGSVDVRVASALAEAKSWKNRSELLEKSLARLLAEREETTSCLRIASRWILIGNRDMRLPKNPSAFAELLHEIVPFEVKAFSGDDHVARVEVTGFLGHVLTLHLAGEGWTYTLGERTGDLRDDTLGDVLTELALL